MASINPFIPSPTLIKRPRSRFLGKHVAMVFSAIRQAWQAYIRYKRLAVMTDKALAARGLRRQDIGRHAFFEPSD